MYVFVTSIFIIVFILYDETIVNFNYMCVIYFYQINSFLSSKFLVKAYFIDKSHAVINKRITEQKNYHLHVQQD